MLVQVDAQWVGNSGIHENTPKLVNGVDNTGIASATGRERKRVYEAGRFAKWIVSGCPN